MARRSRGPGLAEFAAFIVDPDGRVACWPESATRLFGLTTDAVTGRDVREVLTGHGVRELVDQALAEAAAGRAWSATRPVALAGDVVVMVRCEPLAGPPSGALVSALRAPPGSGWLSWAASRIGSTLELVRTAREVAETAVPGFADAAAIFVPEPMLAAGELAGHRAGHAVVRRLAACLAGQPAAVTDQLLPPDEVLILPEDSPRSQAMTGRGPVLFGQFDAETAGRLATRPGGQELTSAYSSFLAMPLLARGAVVGCAPFARAASGAPFGSADIAEAGELTSRAALCLDNARLYERERRTAATLQQGLLPRRSQVPPGIEVAHQYQPAGDSLIGGDWHDVVPLPGGRAALIVGDAMGHGLDAAAVMAQLRTAAHVLAGLDLPPAQVLHRLDAMAAELAVAPFAATCVCLVIDPSGRSCQIAQAGHHPPVLALGGTTQDLELPPGLPLGLGTGSFQATQIGLPPDATIAVYTDGLVESRSRPLDQGMAALHEVLGPALQPPGRELGAACAAVIQAMSHDSEDDITLVLARIRH